MHQTSAGARLAVDIGGTFTDIVLLSGKRRLVSKLLTTPRAPEQAVIAGVRDILASAGLAFRDIGVFVHGTTLATNAIIERKGAKTALHDTQGFRDVIEIADEGRFDQYDINIVKPRATGAARAALHGARAHGRARRAFACPSMSRLCARLPGACASSASMPWLWRSSTPTPIPRTSCGSAKFWPKSALA